MPERADPHSEEARLIGPLVPERIRAIKRRWWNSQTGKIRAPVAVQVSEDGIAVRDVQHAKHLLEQTEHGMEYVSLEKGQARLALLENKATVPPPAQPLPPRRLQTAEQRATAHLVPPKTQRPVVKDAERRTFRPTSRNTKWHNPKQITARLLRRRAAETLEIAPIVKVNVTGKGRPRYEVAKSDFAKGAKGRFAEIGEEDLRWFERGETGQGGKQRGQRSSR